MLCFCLGICVREERRFCEWGIAFEVGGSFLWDSGAVFCWYISKGLLRQSDVCALKGF